MNFQCVVHPPLINAIEDIAKLIFPAEIVPAFFTPTLVGFACKGPGTTKIKLKHEFLNGKIFSSLNAG